MPGPVPPVDPVPPAADLRMPWDEPVADPTAELAAARAELGDTFVVASGGTTYLFLCSPAGVRSFYALPEERASKGVADWILISRKLPEELFAGRRTMVHDLFDRDRTAAYLAQLDGALDREAALLGTGGTVDVFALTRRLGHRLGLACWAGLGTGPDADEDGFGRLVAALDELDGAAAFVDPAAMAEVAARGKDRERAALAVVEELVGAHLARRDADPDPPDDLFGEIVGRWRDEPRAGRATGIAHDVVLVHLGSMSNLFAALGWLLVHLLERPALADRVRAGDRDLAERCALESVRVAQRSIMLRAVLAPVEVADEDRTYRVAPGAMVATHLPLTNTTAAPGLDRYDPDRWRGRRLVEQPGLAARELVTTFGHGRHTCPAQPFSLAAMTRSVAHLLRTFDLEPRWTEVRPPPGQVGGVARSAGPCPVAYRRRP